MNNCSFDCLTKLLQNALGHGSFYQSALDVDWHDVLEMSIAHGVSALASDGLQIELDRNEHLSRFFDTPDNEIIKYQWFGQSIVAEQNYSHIKNTLAIVDAKLNNTELKLLLFKGMSLALLYPVPCHREFCDADVFEINRSWRCINDFFIELNSSLGDVADRHSSFVFNDVSFENHRAFSTGYLNKRNIALNDDLLLCAPSAVLFPGFNNIYCPTNTFNQLFVFAHAKWDFCRGLLTVRQLIDCALVLKSLDFNLDWEKLERYRLDKFANLVCLFSKDKLGFISIPDNYCSCSQSEYQMFLDDLSSYNPHAKKITGRCTFFKKISRSYSRKWAYKLVGEPYCLSMLDSLIKHIRYPWMFNN